MMNMFGLDDPLHNLRNLPQNSLLKGPPREGLHNPQHHHKLYTYNHHNMMKGHQHQYIQLRFERTLRPEGKRRGRAGSFSWPGKVNSKYNAPVPTQQDNPVFLFYVGTVLGRL